MDEKMLEIGISIPAYRLIQNWRLCGMLANYLAGYASYQYQEIERAENVISITLNELLESLVALSPADSYLEIKLQQDEHCMRIKLEHCLRPDFTKPYISFFEEVQASFCHDWYMKLLVGEKKNGNYFNQLGLVMLAADFGVSFAVTVPANSKAGHICTTLKITNKELVK